MIANLDRAVAAIDILGDELRTPIDRYDAVTAVLDGLVLSELPEDARGRFEFEGVRCNQILSKYEIKSADDFAKIGDDDARQLLTYLLGMAQVAQDAAIETILARLHHHGRKLPVNEIETARRHRALFTPILMQELLDSVRSWREDPELRKRDEDHSTLPFFTFLLMYEWEVDAAVPLIVDSLHLPGEAPTELYGDLVHEQLPRFLAHFLPDTPDRIEALIRDAKANMYVRWASSSAFVRLVGDDKMTAAEAIRRLTKLFFDCRVIGDDGRPGRGHTYELSAGILESISQLGGASETNLFDTDAIWKFVDESIMSREDFFSGEPDQRPLRHPSQMEDCLDELKSWAAFSEPEIVKPRPKPLDRPRPTPQVSAQRQPVSLASPAKNSAKRIGRNQQCPCGSGKKHKKCCMKPGES